MRPVEVPWQLVGAVEDAGAVAPPTRRFPRAAVVGVPWQSAVPLLVLIGDHETKNSFLFGLFVKSLDELGKL